MSEPYDFGSKVKAARKAEQYTQTQMSEITGIPYGTYKSIEHGLACSLHNLGLILKQPRMKRYLMWIVLGEVAPESGQINPEMMKRLGGGKQISDEELQALCGVEQLAGKIVDIDAVQRELIAELSTGLTAQVKEQVAAVIQKHQ